MTTAVDDLVSLFAAKLRMDGTWVSPVAQGSRNVHVEYHGDHLTLVLPEGDLSTLLAEGDELGTGPLGPVRLSSGGRRAVDDGPPAGVLGQLWPRRPLRNVDVPQRLLLQELTDGTSTRFAPCAAVPHVEQSRDGFCVWRTDSRGRCQIDPVAVRKNHNAMNTAATDTTATAARLGHEERRAESDGASPDTGAGTPTRAPTEALITIIGRPM